MAISCASEKRLACSRFQYMLILIFGIIDWFWECLCSELCYWKNSFVEYVIAILHVAQHWCMCGDWNMIESPTDRLGGSSITISSLELCEWEKLNFRYENIVWTYIHQ